MAVYMFKFYHILPLEFLVTLIPNIDQSLVLYILCLKWNQNGIMTENQQNNSVERDKGN